MEQIRVRFQSPTKLVEVFKLPFRTGVRSSPSPPITVGDILKPTVFMLETLLNFLFPRRCVSCGRLGRYLCPRCCSIIRFIEKPVCPVCERASIGGGTHPGCQTRYTLDGLTSIWVYEGTVKKAIKELKYRFVTDLAKEITSLIGLAATNFSTAASQPVFQSMGHSTQSEIGVGAAVKRRSKIVARHPFSDYILTVVPLHPSRLRWRGFNQAEILGRIIAEKLKIKFIPNLLIRKKPTRPQVELKGKARRENITDAFSLVPNILISQYPKILLFDDVWTTGATLRVCGNILKRAGAKTVWGLTLAR